jgi:drug/metabolite transporter (DMT)-like permease
MSRRSRAELALVGITITWGATFVVVKNALEEISPLLFIALRFALAAVVLGLIYGSAIRRKALNAGILAGGLLFSAFALQTIGLTLTTPSKSAFLTSLSIPMVPLLSSFVYKSRPRLLEGVGIVVASFGMVLMTFPSSFRTGNFDIGRGDLLTMFCAVLFAFHIVVVGHFSRAVGFESLAVIQIAVVAALALSVFRFGGPVRFHPTSAVATAVLATGLVTTALAFTTMAWAQQYTTPTRAALIFALEPVVAWLTSYLLAGEGMENRAKWGAGLILSGILLVEVKPAGLKRLKQDRHQTE